MTHLEPMLDKDCLGLALTLACSQVETVVRENWVARKMWRLDFQDSVLVAVERAESQ